MSDIPSAGDAKINPTNTAYSCPNPPCTGDPTATNSIKSAADLLTVKVACKMLNDPICPVVTHCCGTARLPVTKGTYQLQPAITDMNVCGTSDTYEYTNPEDTTVKY